MKANKLEGDYCQTCATTLDHWQRVPAMILVLCHSCVGILKSSGDYDRLFTPGTYVKEKPVAQAPVDSPAKPESPPAERAPAKPAKKSKSFVSRR